MSRALAASLVALVLAVPASAREVTPEADKVMWCASAFFWLAGSADDAGDADEAELYDGWANQLTERGTALLTTSGFDLARTQEIIGEYDALVLDELASEKPRYDVATCPELVAE
ncbi:MAG: hypothetical protein Q8L54_12295 [Devosia sp.]|nr:hypothetical protein [Devosia sp.]